MNSLDKTRQTQPENRRGEQSACHAKVHKEKSQTVAALGRQSTEANMTDLCYVR